MKIKDWKPIDPTVSNFVEDQKNIYLNPGYGGQAYPRFSSYPGRLQCRRQLAQWANAIGEQGQQTHIMSVISDMNPPSVTLKKSLS